MSAAPPARARRWARGLWVYAAPLVLPYLAPDGCIVSLQNGINEERIAAVEAKLGDPKLYTAPTGAADSAKLRADLQAAKAEVERLTARWEELESRREGKA